MNTEENEVEKTTDEVVVPEEVSNEELAVEAEKEPEVEVASSEEVKPEYVAILQKADYIFIEELRKSGYYDKVSQAFAVFLPVKTVAVMGDARRYEYVIALRAVETIDFMTAVWAHLPYELLGKISLRICNEIAQVSRVVYDITGKPPATIEWE